MSESKECQVCPTTNNLSPEHRRKWGYILYLLAFLPIVYGAWASRDSSKRMQLLQAYYGSSQQACCIIDNEGCVVPGFWSKGCQDLFGWSPEEASQKSIAMLIPMNMLARHSERFEDRINRIKAQGVLPDEKTMVIRCEAMTKGLDKVDLRITLRFFEFEDDPYINATFDKADQVEFLKAPKEEPIRSSSSIFHLEGKG